MNRWDVINSFISKREYKSYLEIGYYKGWSFDQVNCSYKVAVDPNPSKLSSQEDVQYGKKIAHIKKSGVEYISKCTSNEFFSKNTEKFDIIFIDGLHEAKQVEKDIFNSLKILNDNGVVILHDCNPPTEEHTLGGVDGCWNGDVYKTIMAIKAINPNVYVINTDWGIGIIEKFEIDDIEIVNELDWNHFDQDRKDSIGLIEVQDFYAKIQDDSPQVKVKELNTIVDHKNNKELVFVSAQPDDLRFSFQVEIFLENTIRLGYTNDIHILLYVPFDRINNQNERFKMLENRYKQSNPNIKFFWYNDNQNEVLPLANRLEYIPLLRPWTLRQHWLAYPNLENKAIFYHDNDIIFTKYLDFSKWLSDDIHYLSHTGQRPDNYLNYSYLKGKSRQVLPERLNEFNAENVVDKIAKLNGITEEILKQNDDRTGGAQTLLKNIDANFWLDVYNSIISIRSFFWYNYPNSINGRFFRNEDAGYQSWCADMLALVWNIWKRGYRTEVPIELNFAWATDNVKLFDDYYIYHDAGVVGQNTNYLFNKNKDEYKNNLRLPYGEDFSYVDKSYCSYKYVEEINRVKQKYNY